MRLPRRANLLYTFQVGYGFVQLPLGLFSFATTIYYLLVNNVGFLKTLFPEFWMFLVVGGLMGGPTCLLIGQWYILSPLNKASTRTHPFSQFLIPTQFPMYVAVAKLCRAQGLVVEADEIEELVRRSREVW
jgi:hypothetical protein